MKIEDKDIKRVVPPLRFPEFRDAEGWEEESVGNLYIFKSTNTFSRDALNYSSGFVKNIHYGDIHTKFATLFDIRKEVVPYINADIEIDKFPLDCFCQVSDVIFADASEDLEGIGKSIEIVNLNNEKVLSGLHTILARQRNANFITGFAGYLFMSDGIKAQINKESQGAKVLGISSKRLSNITLYFPKSNIEQTKITYCLSSLDDLISAVTDKIETLKEYKKGLMQQLFPAEGKTTPALRFPEFQNAGEWKNTIFDTFFTIKSSKRILQENWTSQGVPFYRTRELVSLSKGKPLRNEIFINEKLFEKLSEKYGVPSKDDFLVSGVGTLGICYQINTNDKFYFKDGNVLWFKLKKGLYSTFFKYCFQSDYVQKQILGQTSKSTVGTYTIQNAKQTRLWYPTSIEEQYTIAKCLSSVDELISAKTEKLEQIKTHKKGLMQQLFPTINE